jgi:hypothetical protein
MAFSGVTAVKTSMLMEAPNAKTTGKILENDVQNLDVNSQYEKKFFYPKIFFYPKNFFSQNSEFSVKIQSRQQKSASSFEIFHDSSNAKS